MNVDPQVRAWMRETVLVFHEQTDGLLARDAIEAHVTGHACVLRDGKLVGVLSDRDIPCVEEVDGEVWTVGEVMTAEPTTVAPETPLVDAITTMLEEHIHCLPVVRNEEVVGILTERELLEALLVRLRVEPPTVFSATAGGY